ncbi:hypothetical protein A1OQ_13540 [Enterovibrio norvegicus FF-162]|uniref:hypothetical protein n=1 Tax=Enterovibrio TaxID=188143 RepID=UPI00037D84A3|nr:hypothetical protein [Enterovibrio norvegicus]OEE88356.1 hypothetical protein A1OQ_13540 [Enterovibrio norvegicus FF-162]
MAMSANERREKTDKRRKRSGLKTVRLYMTESDKQVLINLAKEVGFSKPSGEDLSSVVCAVVRQELSNGHDVCLNSDSLYLTKLRDIILHRKKLKISGKNSDVRIASFLTKSDYKLPKQIQDYGIEDWNPCAIRLMCNNNWFKDNLIGEFTFDDD